MPPQRQTFRQIADDLADRIRSGEYPPGSKLPSANKLADLYDVHRNTAQQALLLLRDRGLTEGVPGVGTFVATNAGPSTK